MANTYTAIATTTVGSPTASIVFSSIPQTYTDLVIQISARTPVSTGQLDVLVGLNGNTNQTNWRILQGDGSAAYSVSSSNTYGRGGVIPAANATANIFSDVEIYIPSYANSTLQKAYSSNTVMENNATSNYLEFVGGTYTQTTAVTSITLSVTSGNNFSQYTTATLYGIKNS